MKASESNPPLHNNGQQKKSFLDGALALAGASKRKSAASPNYPIIVHSHLRWDWVWQRPQQFLSRFAPRHRVLFVEGPQLTDEDTEPCYRLREAEGASNVTVMQTMFPASRFQDGAWVDAQRRRLLKEALANELKGQFDKPLHWFYDPMAVTAHAGHFDEIATVYDCMDELSKFKFAPPELIARERELLALADVVFTGGRKMRESKSRHNSNCHFYGCGVDVAHFGKARQAATAIPDDIADIEGPVLGYFGVVDERLDYELIGRLAKENPEFTVVIVGPVCKVDAAEFPQAENLRWLGGRDYAHLPNYTRRFDVCLMPFALNDATEYINPTKALEYMAAGKPIVSTPVSDVVRNFGSVVKIGRSAERILELCREEVAQPDLAAIAAGLKMARENTWEAIVSKMEGHIADALVAQEKLVYIKADAAPVKNEVKSEEKEAPRAPGKLVPALAAMPVGK